MGSSKRGAGEAASKDDSLARLPRLLRWPVKTARGLLFSHSYFRPFFCLVLLAEFVLGLLIIRRVAYTEIDWIAYMEEVAGFLGGQYDYAELRGQTGPLVYPAGFVYLYSALYWITQAGSNILLAQYIFLGLYLAFIALLLLIYHEARLCPPWVMLLLCASRRIHSIFMLRCFNDCFAMFFLYAAVYLMLKNRWTLACVLVSVALSIKMNILLFMPALGVLLLQRFGVWRTISRLMMMVAIQLALGLPFLLHAPANYLRLSFDFGRAFFYIWTVNLRVLDEATFLDPRLAKGLLAAHLIVLIIFINRMVRDGLGQFIVDQLRVALTKAEASLDRPSAGYIVSLMFISNFIGIVFARSLHYQFYVWYYHSLPLLLWVASERLPVWARLLLLACVEYSWNVFPATEQSSGVLIGAHLTLLVALLFSSRLPQAPSTTPTSGAAAAQRSGAKKVQ